MTAQSNQQELRSLRDYVLGLDKFVREKGLSRIEQLGALIELSCREFMLPSQLSNEMKFSTAAATGLIDLFEKHGYARRLERSEAHIVKKTHPELGRRAQPFVITDKGISLVEQFRNKAKELKPL